MQLGFVMHNDVQAFEAECRFAARHEFSALDIQVWHTTAQLSVSTVTKMRQLLDAYGLRCAALSLWGVNHLAADSDIRRHAHHERMQITTYAEILGAAVVVMGAGDASKVLDENVMTFAHVMRPCIDALAAQQIPLALYGFYDGFLDTPMAFERLWSVVGDVGIALDVASIVHAGHDYLDFVRRHGKRVRHVYVRDTLIQHGVRIAEPPAGMGDIAWGKVLGLLYEAEFAGVLAIAPHGQWTRPGMRERMLLLSKYALAPYVLP
jgi:sugar phosphate isomerase/epimerase